MNNMKYPILDGDSAAILNNQNTAINKNKSTMFFVTISIVLIVASIAYQQYLEKELYKKMMKKTFFNS